MDRRVISRIVIAGAVLAYLGSGVRNNFEMALMWLGYAVIIAHGRMRLRPWIDGFIGSTFAIKTLRGILEMLPIFAMPYLLWRPQQAWGVSAGVIWGVLLVATQYKTLQLTLSSQFIEILPPLSKERRLASAYAHVLIPSAQEIFYKAVMLTILIPYLSFYAIFVMSGLFVFSHYLQLNAEQNFRPSDYVYQGALSLGLGAIYFLSGSLLGCILGHLVFNLPMVYQVLKREPQPATSFEN